jgi:hypothetical protein|nr:hypothetical protein [Kofleriaceae bacterium]
MVALDPSVRADPGLGITPSAPASAVDPRPDPPPRSGQPAVPVDPERRSIADLDGVYVWLGPDVGAGYLASSWDSTIGADLTVLRVRERERLGAVGGSLGAARWTERGGGRVWADAVAGTRLWNRTMVGLSAGGIVELADTEHPRVGAMVGAWAFVGLTPYVRVGAIDGYGAVVELGIHIALPVLRR